MSNQLARDFVTEVSRIQGSQITVLVHEHCSEIAGVEQCAIMEFIECGSNQDVHQEISGKFGKQLKRFLFLKAKWQQRNKNGTHAF
jgi:hypothetical protein